jgi:hypothetical protein
MAEPSAKNVFGAARLSTARCAIPAETVKAFDLKFAKNNCKRTLVEHPAGRVLEEIAATLTSKFL